MLIIPTTSDGARRASVDLGEIVGVWTFRTYWNPTAKIWNIDIYDSDDSPVILGVALPPTIDICNPFPELRDVFPELRVADLKGTGNATPTSLGTDAILAQYDEGEIPAPSDIYDPIVDLGDVLQ